VNPYVSPDLAFTFHYFAIRKLHFLQRAMALVAFPGGFGTFDELFEVLALTQTRKVRPMPIVLVGERYWREAVNMDFLAREGVIDAEDRDLFWVRRDGAGDLGRHPELEARQRRTLRRARLRSREPRIWPGQSAIQRTFYARHAAALALAGRTEDSNSVAKRVLELEPKLAERSFLHPSTRKNPNCPRQGRNGRGRASVSTICHCPRSAQRDG
jgi:hypothetical protein